MSSLATDLDVCAKSSSSSSSSSSFFSSHSLLTVQTRAYDQTKVVKKLLSHSYLRHNFFSLKLLPKLLKETDQTLTKCYCNVDDGIKCLICNSLSFSFALSSKSGGWKMSRTIHTMHRALTPMTGNWRTFFCLCLFFSILLLLSFPFPFILQSC